MNFGDLLSELNPLQYIPLVGTLYRAITGDTIPETARNVGSLVLSGITGGPIGIAMSAGAMAIEKATGLDPEKIGRAVLADIGIGHATRNAAPAPGVAAPPPPPPHVAWSAEQLHALGVTRDAGGDLRLGALAGSDVLNALELRRTAGVSRLA